MLVPIQDDQYGDQTLKSGHKSFNRRQIFRKSVLSTSSSNQERCQEWLEDQEKRTYMAAKRSGGKRAMEEETKGRNEGDPS